MDVRFYINIGRRIYITYLFEEQNIYDAAVSFKKIQRHGKYHYGCFLVIGLCVCELNLNYLFRRLSHFLYYQYKF